MKKFFSLWQKFGMFALLIILVVGFSIASPSTFFTTTTMFNILKQASVTGVFACAVTMILITGSIDLSVASRAAVTTLLVASMMLNGMPIWFAIVCGILFSVVSGILNAVLAEILHTSMFIVTMAINYIWIAVCYLTVGAGTLYNLPAEFKMISQTLIFGQIPSIILVFVVCAIVASFILSKTYFGRHIYALGGNREAAYLAGINVVKTNILTHAVAGVFIGIGAIILLSRTMIATSVTSSASYAFDCMIACVLGGVFISGGGGKMYQAILGILVINVMFNGLTIIGVSDYWQGALKGGLLFLAVGLEVLQRYFSAKQKEKVSLADGAVKASPAQ